MNEVSIKEFSNICIGNAEDEKNATGCTVIIAKDGMRAGLDIRGGGPASRESSLLDPLTSAEYIHAVMLGGGSAFGLSASGGVLDYLLENNIGYDTGVKKIPLVVQSDIYDLTVGSSDVYPDIDMGYQAAKNAFTLNNYKDGNYGVGCGASVGKLYGIEYAMKSGIGSYCMDINGLKVGAIVVVNAFGDIYDCEKKVRIGGLLNKNKDGFSDTCEEMKKNINLHDNKFITNTTIGAVITNANFNKTKLCKIAGMAHDGMARAINPVHTSADGDSIYALSVGELKVDMDLVGILAAEAVSKAISCAVKSAKPAYGLKAYSDIVGNNSK